jgi:hypothetical protein
MDGRPFLRIHRAGPLTPEEVARDRAIRREVYAEFPSLRMTRYRDLAGKLAQMQRANEGHEPAEEDALLEEMDRIWTKLTVEERDVIGHDLAPPLKPSSEKSLPR